MQPDQIDRLAEPKRPMFFFPDSGRTQVLSFGGGTQSTAIAVLILQGKLPKPDLAVFVDTERECSATFAYLQQYTQPAMTAAGVPIHVIRKSDWNSPDLWSKSDNTLMLPAFTTFGGKVGKKRTFCSGEWKRDVSARWTKAQGITQCDAWIGFSVDELTRLKTDRVAWRRSVYPLLELRLRRSGCVSLVESYGWPPPPRSRCWMCPNQRDSEWVDLKAHHPEEFAMAVELEREIRKRDPHFWLHESCKPLDEVAFHTDRLPLFDGMGCESGLCFI